MSFSAGFRCYESAILLSWLIFLRFCLGDDPQVQQLKVQEVYLDNSLHQFCGQMYLTTVATDSFTPHCFSLSKIQGLIWSAFYLNPQWLLLTSIWQHTYSPLVSVPQLEYCLSKQGKSLLVSSTRPVTWGWLKGSDSFPLPYRLTPNSKSLQRVWKGWDIANRPTSSSEMPNIHNATFMVAEWWTNTLKWCKHERTEFWELPNHAARSNPACQDTNLRRGTGILEAFNELRDVIIFIMSSHSRSPWELTGNRDKVKTSEWDPNCTMASNT